MHGCARAPQLSRSVRLRDGTFVAMRHSSLRTFGWSWAVAGVFNVICVSICTLTYHEQGDGWAANADQFSSAPRWLAHLFALLSRHGYAVVLFGLAMGLFTIVAAVSFLRFRPWARIGLELLCWCGILVGVVGVLYIYTLRRTLLGYH